MTLSSLSIAVLVATLVLIGWQLRRRPMSRIEVRDRLKALERSTEQSAEQATHPVQEPLDAAPVATKQLVGVGRALAAIGVVGVLMTVLWLARSSTDTDTATTNAETVTAPAPALSARAIPPAVTPVAPAVRPVSRVRDELDEDASSDADQAPTLASADATEPAGRLEAVNTLGETALLRDTDLAIVGSGVGEAVIDKTLVGVSNVFDIGARVAFWTEVSGGQAGDLVRHVWLHEGQPAGSVELPVEGPRWRTHSRRTLVQGTEGDWAVEARDVSGRLLVRREFRVDP